jgi:hypothetical protein
VALTALALFVLALLLRLAHVWQIRSAPFFTLMMGDSRAYDEWARRIAAGDWIGRDVFYQAPLYPYFLAVLYNTVGRDPLTVRIVQAAIGSASCALVFSRRPAFLLAPRWSGRRVRVGSVGAGNLLRRADSEIGARCVLCVRHLVVAVKSRNRRAH